MLLWWFESLLAVIACCMLLLCFVVTVSTLVMLKPSCKGSTITSARWSTWTISQPTCPCMYGSDTSVSEMDGAVSWLQIMQGASTAASPKPYLATIFMCMTATSNALASRSVDMITPARRDTLVNPISCVK